MRPERTGEGRNGDLWRTLYLSDGSYLRGKHYRGTHSCLPDDDRGRKLVSERYRTNLVNRILRSHKVPRVVGVINILVDLECSRRMSTYECSCNRIFQRLQRRHIFSPTGKSRVSTGSNKLIT